MEQIDNHHTAAMLTAALVPVAAVKILYKCLDAMKDEIHQRSLAKKRS